MNTKILFLALLLFAGFPSASRAAVSAQPSSDISLAGTWQFALDPQNAGEAQGWYAGKLPDTISLPSTTDEAGKGPESVPGNNEWGLTRRHPYVGLAWYSRNIVAPADWAGKDISLMVERTKEITISVDGGAPIEGGNSLCAPHIVSLGKIAPGPHVLTVCVDNRLSNWPDRVSASHMLEDSTQTNWNGMIGKIEIAPTESMAIRGVCASAVDHNPRMLQVKAYFDTLPPGLVLKATLTQNGVPIGQSSATGDTLVINAAKTAKLWNEFEPKLCSLSVTATAPGVYSAWNGTIGLRDFRSVDGAFEDNGARVFLRGKHDACVFPLTGHPPMDVVGWIRYFTIIKSYGLNHIRFHSWCPPDAAFTAADKLGVYLQPELPFWGDPSKPGVESFLTDEGVRILKAYGHHPSFVMLSLGNELWGDDKPRYRMVNALRAVDPTRLYDHGSNSWYWAPQEYKGTDYTVGAFAASGEVGKLRGSYSADNVKVEGYIQTGVTGTMHTYTDGLAALKLPFVSHEVGQYEVYPNFAEMAKYTGVVRADNFAIFKQRLSNAGMLDEAEQFRQASGLLSLQCYREEIEAALRTPKMSGFDLLDLQDYPGQGTALVGMLDAFMDSKGFVTPIEWRQFCSSFTPLAMFPKYTWRTDETFTAEVRVANYTGTDSIALVRWQLAQGDRVIAHGVDKPAAIPAGNATTIGNISCPLAAVVAPARVVLTVSVAGHVSSWPIWVYPTAAAQLASVAAVPSVTVTPTLDTVTLQKLAAGGSVLYIPTADQLPNSYPGFFTPDFWCYTMFKGGNPPGTLGLLIQDQNPALAQFPTRFYSEWQWQDLAHNSRAVILDSLTGYKPIVQPIDNVDRNHRLGSIFELKVGQGRLLVCAFDILDMPNSPEAAQLLVSLTHYANSPAFNPTTQITPDALTSLLSGKN